MKRMLLSCAAAALVASATLAVAGTAEQASIVAGCMQSTNWPAGACQCMADKAGALTDVQQGFLAATLNEDAAAATQLRLQMSMAEMTEAALFVANTGPSCINQ
jgi:hypothetical protein